ncbi:glycoside hydrolase family 43 protein [Paraflavisolibacter sp. H34]|uniref:glycoside hydrolase family 43 protein n=1 Tax=Huijunlia imazamoxiresistens TaxID=3127457 RepID=UPI003015F75B
MKRILSLIMLLALVPAACLASTNRAAQKPLTDSLRSRKAFVPGALWYDTRGEVINAHGGGLLYDGKRYYWYGEKRGRSASEGVNVYSSKDLYNWTFEGLALAPATDTASDIARGCLMERPKVIYNKKTRKYVLWFHLELRGKGYSAARAAVAVSDRPTGPFTFVRSFRPNGNMSRDMTLFVDDDGSAYHLYSSNENYDLRICKLTDDYQAPTSQDVMLFSKHREAPALMKHRGTYYLVTSGCTGWDPNAASLHTATSPWGPWTLKGDPMKGPGAGLTFGGQSTHIQPVMGKKDAFLFMADKWNPRDLRDSRYLWLPVQFRDGLPQIEWQDQWDLGFFGGKK